jgi:hypothetical protein
MTDLDRLVAAARDLGPAWDDARAARVLSRALGRRERRLVVDRTVRRALAVTTGAALVALVFLRGASASPPSSPAGEEPAPVSAVTAASWGDAGYARD